MRLVTNYYFLSNVSPPAAKVIHHSHSVRRPRGAVPSPSEYSSAGAVRRNADASRVAKRWRPPPVNQKCQYKSPLRVCECTDISLINTITSGSAERGEARTIADGHKNAKVIEFRCKLNVFLRRATLRKSTTGRTPAAARFVLCCFYVSSEHNYYNYGSNIICWVQN